MAGFIFRYQRLLNIKKEVEDEIKNELAIEIQKLTRIKNELSNDINNQKDYLKKINSKIKKGVSASELKKFNSDKEYFTTKINKLKNNILKQKNIIINKRQELNLAVQETKKYEKLREKRFEIYKKKIEKKEEKEIEEIVNYKNYKMSGGKYGE